MFLELLYLRLMDIDIDIHGLRDLQSCADEWGAVLDSSTQTQLGSVVTPSIRAVCGACSSGF